MHGVPAGETTVASLAGAGGGRSRACARAATSPPYPPLRQAATSWSFTPFHAPVETRYLAPKLRGQCVVCGAEGARWGIRAVFFTLKRVSSRSFSAVQAVRQSHRCHDRCLADSRFWSWYRPSYNLLQFLIPPTPSLITPPCNSLSSSLLVTLSPAAGTNSDSYIEYLAKGSCAWQQPQHRRIFCFRELQYCL